MPTSLSGRIVTLVATSQGMIFYAHAGDAVWSAPTNSTTTPMLDLTALNFASANIGSLWFVDGTNYRQFNAETTTVTAWTASAGNMPLVNGTAARGTETWRGRTVVFGLLGDSYDWFMSAIGDPTNWDYAPVSPGPADAVSGGTGPQGKVPDVITGFAPYTDDIAYLGCSHSIYQFTGDPQSGGSIDLITDEIGMAWGRAWTKDPYGNLYFMSNRTGLYMAAPGQQLQRISFQIDNLLKNINTGTNAFTLLWNDVQQGIHVWITPLAGGATTHYFLEKRTNGWFADQHSENLHNPLCACQFDGNNPEDRVVVIGSFDGVVRFLDANAQDDDNRPIFSSVIFPPMISPGLDDMILTEWQAVLGSDSNSVAWQVLAGTTCEQALDNEPQEEGTWEPGRNDTQYVNVRSHVIYPMMTADLQWRMENIRAIVRTGGPKSARAKN